MMNNNEVLNKTWRYSVNKGDRGGLVFATTKDDAKLKIERKYKRKDCLVWRMEDDDYFDSSNPDVWETYGI